MRFIYFIKKNCISVGFLICLINLSGTAQIITPNTLTNVNLLDSVNIKRYSKWIDTHRIHIEFNRMTGIASFYSKKFDDSLTANGERFSNSKLTAACNLFKINTILRVTNLRNGIYVLVRVNDRMHPTMLQKGRIIDLSQLAAKKLVINTKGLVRVSIEAIGYSKTTPKS